MQEEISVKDLATEIINQINSSAKIISDSERIRPEKSEVFRLYGSNEKIKKHTNWEPKYNLKSGLAETIEWFRNSDNLKAYKADIYNI
jgi:nucleoside-diphosphate-sugar epimerase